MPIASKILNSLTQYHIEQPNTLYHNPSYDTLFEHETSSELPDSERGRITQLGAVAINTGRYTGRSPKDKYIVVDDAHKQDVWWREDGSDNKPLSQDNWSHLHALASTQLSGKTLYVMDGYCGANPKTRLAVRLVTEVAWMAHFFKNMFIRPTDEELTHFEPDWVILNACKTQCNDFKERGLNSPTFVAFHLEERMTLIGGTWYGGEIKKGIFSVMNFFLPLQGIGSFHCSANQGKEGDTALFFGLSGTGKTTLSTDPKRALIGDDEHGWDDEGIFNLEGGCYAKMIDLSPEHEPDIYNALRRDALLENVVVRKDSTVDFEDDSKTQNTRASYPIDHIENIVRPMSRGGHPKKVIFLTCDAYGVLPPVSKLTKGQAMYQYLSGYTAKIAGTELGITEPVATFSACFGQPFLLLHPVRYAEILGKKMDLHEADAYLVNTGWTEGGYGEGYRISIAATRAIIDAILDGSIERVEMETLPVFNFQIPKKLAGVPTKILNPRNAWHHPAYYDAALNKLAKSFIKNFQRFTTHAAAQTLLPYGPDIS